MFAGFAAGHDRGKLIMACGTGKTFTALKVAERLAAENGGVGAGAVRWCRRSRCCPRRCGSGPPRPSSTCARSRCAPTPRSPGPPRTSASTTSPSRPPPIRRQLAARDAAPQAAPGPDGGLHDLPVAAGGRRRPDSTGWTDFDLVICDEAHRTTGVTLAGADESQLRAGPRRRLPEGDAAALHDRHPADLRREGQGQGRRSTPPS